MRKNKNFKEKRKKYHQLHWFERGLDILLIAGLVLGLVFIILNFFFSFQQKFRTLILIFEVVFIGIVFLDMSRTFIKSKNIWQFFKHHWIDTVILTFCIVSFSSVLYAGIGRFSWLLREESIIFEEAEGVLPKILKTIKVLK